MIEETKSDSVEMLIKDAEMILRKSLDRLGELSEQARELLEDKPTAILALAAVSGLVTGTLLRQSITQRRSPQPMESSDLLQEVTEQKQPVDPLFLVAGGLVAGMLFGPRLIKQAFAGLEKLNPRPARAHEFERTHLHAAGSMSQRPFEKF